MTADRLIGYVTNEQHQALADVAVELDGPGGADLVRSSPTGRVVKPDHWIFAGTGLGTGDCVGERSLDEHCSGGASGHETDEITALSPPGCVALAKGTNPDEGGAEIVFRETPGGGSVFSVGSITWPASILVDDAVSRITANVFNRSLEAAR